MSDSSSSSSSSDGEDEAGSLEAYGRMAGHEGSITCMAAAGGNQLFTGSSDRTAICWDMLTRRLVTRFRGHSGIITALAVWRVQRENSLLTASQDGTIRLWHLHTGHTLSVFKGHTGHILCLAFANGCAVSAGRDAAVRVWDAARPADAATGAVAAEQEMLGHEKPVRSVCVDADAGDKGVAYTGGDDCTVRGWDLASGAALAVFRGHTAAVQCVRVCSDRLFSSGADRTARMWRVSNGRCLRRFRGHHDAVKCLEVQDEGGGRGTFVYTGSRDGTARRYDVTKARLPLGAEHVGGEAAERLAEHAASVGFKKPPTVFGGAEGPINCLAVQGQILFTGSADGTARAYDAATGVELSTYRSHRSPVLAIALYDGICVTGGQDHTCCAVGSLGALLGQSLPQLRRAALRVAAIATVGGTKADEAIRAAAELEAATRPAAALAAAAASYDPTAPVDSVPVDRNTGLLLSTVSRFDTAAVRQLALMLAEAQFEAPHKRMRGALWRQLKTWWAALWAVDDEDDDSAGLDPLVFDQDGRRIDFVQLLGKTAGQVLARLARLGDPVRLRHPLAAPSLAALGLRGLPQLALAPAHITALDVSGNLLRRLPRELGLCARLTSLNCNGNQIRRLPPTLGSLSSLTALDMSANRLDVLTPAIEGCTALRTLSLRRNRLATLPPTLHYLRRLRLLDVERNRLRSLPIEIGGCVALERLALRRNRKLRALPLQVGLCTRLTALELDGGGVGTGAIAALGGLRDAAQLAAYQEGGGAQVMALLGRQFAGKVDRRAGKLVLLGPRGVGKTSLLLALEQFFGLVPAVVATESAAAPARVLPRRAAAPKKVPARLPRLAPPRTIGVAMHAATWGSGAWARRLDGMAHSAEGGLAHAQVAPHPASPEAMAEARVANPFTVVDCGGDAASRLALPAAGLGHPDAAVTFALLWNVRDAVAAAGGEGGEGGGGGGCEKLREEVRRVAAMVEQPRLVLVGTHVDEALAAIARTQAEAGCDGKRPGKRKRKEALAAAEAAVARAAAAVLTMVRKEEVAAALRALRAALAAACDESDPLGRGAVQAAMGDVEAIALRGKGGTPRPAPYGGRRASAVAAEAAAEQLLQQERRDGEGEGQDEEPGQEQEQEQEQQQRGGLEAAGSPPPTASSVASEHAPAWTLAVGTRLWAIGDTIMGAVARLRGVNRVLELCPALDRCLGPRRFASAATGKVKARVERRGSVGWRATTLSQGSGGWLQGENAVSRRQGAGTDDNDTAPAAVAAAAAAAAAATANAKKLSPARRQLLQLEREGVFCLCLRSGPDVQRLQVALARAVTSHASYKRVVPAAHNVLQQLVRAARGRYSPPALSWEQFTSELGVLAGLDADGMWAAVRGLHASGDVHFGGAGGAGAAGGASGPLGNVVVLDPQWLAAVLSRMAEHAVRQPRGAALSRRALAEAFGFEEAEREKARRGSVLAALAGGGGEKAREAAAMAEAVPPRLRGHWLPRFLEHCGALFIDHAEQEQPNILTLDGDEQHRQQKKPRAGGKMRAAARRVLAVSSVGGAFAKVGAAGRGRRVSVARTADQRALVAALASTPTMVGPRGVPVHPSKDAPRGRTRSVGDLHTLQLARAAAARRAAADDVLRVAGGEPRSHGGAATTAAQADATSSPALAAKRKQRAELAELAAQGGAGVVREVRSQRNTFKVVKKRLGGQQGSAAAAAARSSMWHGGGGGGAAAARPDTADLSNRQLARRLAAARWAARAQGARAAVRRHGAAARPPGRTRRGVHGAAVAATKAAEEEFDGAQQREAVAMFGRNRIGTITLVARGLGARLRRARASISEYNASVVKARLIVPALLPAEPPYLPGWLARPDDDDGGGGGQAVPVFATARRYCFGGGLHDGVWGHVLVALRAFDDTSQRDAGQGAVAIHCWGRGAYIETRDGHKALLAARKHRPPLPPPSSLAAAADAEPVDCIELRVRGLCPANLLDAVETALSSRLESVSRGAAVERWVTPLRRLSCPADWQAEEDEEAAGPWVPLDVCKAAARDGRGALAGWGGPQQQYQQQPQDCAPPSEAESPSGAADGAAPLWLLPLLTALPEALLELGGAVTEGTAQITHAAAARHAATRTGLGGADWLRRTSAAGGGSGGTAAAEFEVERACPPAAGLSAPALHFHRSLASGRHRFDEALLHLLEGVTAGLLERERGAALARHQAERDAATARATGRKVPGRRQLQREEEERKQARAPCPLAQQLAASGRVAARMLQQLACLQRRKLHALAAAVLRAPETHPFPFVFCIVPAVPGNTAHWTAPKAWSRTSFRLHLLAEGAEHYAFVDGLPPLPSAAADDDGDGGGGGGGGDSGHAVGAGALEEAELEMSRARGLSVRVPGMQLKALLPLMHRILPLVRVLAAQHQAEEAAAAVGDSSRQPRQRLRRASVGEASAFVAGLQSAALLCGEHHSDAAGARAAALLGGPYERFAFMEAIVHLLDGAGAHGGAEQQRATSASAAAAKAAVAAEAAVQAASEDVDGAFARSLLELKKLLARNDPRLACGLKQVSRHDGSVRWQPEEAQRSESSSA
jgi:WD40 repeat protein